MTKAESAFLELVQIALELAQQYNDTEPQDVARLRPINQKLKKAAYVFVKSHEKAKLAP